MGTKSVKTVINQRNICFSQGDTARYGKLQKQRKRELKLAKCRYKDKVESMLRAGSSPAWEGVKSMMGMQTKKSHVFLNRRRGYQFLKMLCLHRLVLLREARCVNLSTESRKEKSPGPDGIGGHVLKNCADQLADMFTFIFFNVSPASQGPLTLEGLHYRSTSQVYTPH